MKVYEKGGNRIWTLSNSTFLAGGGEGNVHVVGDTALKIYLDPGKMIAEGKISDLASISDPNVIRPRDVICNEKGKAIGYTMRYVPNTLTLCQLFPRSFREREGLDHQKILDLVRTMQQNVQNIHRAGVLVVDLNEMNTLVSQDFTQAFWIDVDSYQTRHFPATAIMPSVSDPLVKHGAFTEMSDWFSFGIIAFQLFIGIHPYKGKHPAIKGMEDRMAAGVSIFDPQVSVPKVCYSLDVIPAVYRDWFRAVFQDKKRVPPPSDLHAVAQILQPLFRTMASTGHLTVQEIRRFESTIRSFFYSGNAGAEVVQTDTGVWLGSSPVKAPISQSVQVGYTAVGGHAILAQLSTNQIILTTAGTGENIPFVSYADEVSSYEGRVYVRSHDQILEVLFTETQHPDGRPKIIAAPRVVCSVMERASHLFQGGVIQNMLGSVYVSLFPRTKASYQIRLPELDGLKVVESRFDSGVLMVTAAKKGVYTRFIFRFADDYLSYDMRKVEDITPAGLNFVTLDSGVCVCLTEDDRLELFSAKKGSAQIKVVDDKMLGGDMLLVKRGGRLGFVRGHTLYEMRMQ